MADSFAEGQRRLQDQFDTRRLADHCYAKLVRNTIKPKQKAFIESADIPKSASPAPVPEWKKLPDMNQVLAANDPARVPPESQ